MCISTTRRKSGRFLAIGEIRKGGKAELAPENRWHLWGPHAELERANMKVSRDGGTGEHLRQLVSSRGEKNKGPVGGSRTWLGKYGRKRDGGLREGKNGSDAVSCDTQDEKSSTLGVPPVGHRMVSAGG